MLEEAFRMANTRHMNKESLRKLKNQEARTIAKVYEKPEIAPKAAIKQEKAVLTPAQAQASGIRLMHKPLKPTISPEPPKEKYSKDKVESLVSRLYPNSKPLSASNSGVKFVIPGVGSAVRELRTLSTVRSRPVTGRTSQSPESVQHREAIHLRQRGLWEREKAPEPLTSRAVPVRPDSLWHSDKSNPEAAQTPQPTTKDSNETPARKSKGDAEDVDSPNISSISHHYEDDSFTRFTAFPEPKPTPIDHPLGVTSPKEGLWSPRYSEEALFLMRNPIKEFMETVKSPTASQVVTSPMNAYRFVVGLNESDEFIYQEDKGN